MKMMWFTLFCNVAVGVGVGEGAGVGVGVGDGMGEGVGAGVGVGEPLSPAFVLLSATRPTPWHPTNPMTEAKATAGTIRFQRIARCSNTEVPPVSTPSAQEGVAD